ncbi:MAG: (2Fe-2S)-binding protein [Acidimicrobiaceae bacterium]|nr:(2Fe-2S)-binding protein [Acidimicrobiaceae bacterium]MBU98122.1 (2Fe-2S)-binding protein [Acidimicrobiaceae bacterium]OUV00111.1 MAG: (2Fe-2S)-binding protein [Acidimicrobiaceae bacterium TMED77]
MSYDIPKSWLGESLLYVLREKLGLYGSKNACEQGECGSCSVMMDGVLVCSCLVLAANATERTIKTIESISNNDALSDVQEAFVETGAIQCGFCTPGLLVTIHDFLETNPQPNVPEIREAISGNLCRCTGYGRIIEAVQITSKRRISEQGGPDVTS